MRISDWSSDVCSSDLLGEYHRGVGCDVAMRGVARRLNADGAAVEPVGQAAAGDEAVERSGDMVGKAAAQGHVSGLSWIESIDARPIAAWAARQAMHRLRAAGSHEMAGRRAARPLSSPVK